MQLVSGGPALAIPHGAGALRLTGLPLDNGCEFPAAATMRRMTLSSVGETWLAASSRHASRRPSGQESIGVAFWRGT